MALTLLKADGFDVYDTAGIALNWTSAGTNTATDLTGTISRSGLGCLKIISSANGPSQVLAAHQTNVIMCTAVNMLNVIPTGGSTGSIMRASGGGDVQVRIDVNGDLSLSVLNGNSPSAVVIGTTAPNVMLSNGYNYVSCRFFIGLTTGSVRLWVNGVQVLDLVNVQTQKTGAVAYVDTLQLFALGGNVTWYHDDVTFWTWTDPVNDNFPYAPSVYPALPVSDSTPLNWTPSSAGAHFSLVNAVPEQTTTYVSDATPGDIDQYIHAIPSAQKIPPLPTAQTVLGVYHALLAEIDSAGARTIASNKAGAAGPMNFALITSYTYFGQPYTPGLAHYTDLPTTPFGPEVTA